MSENTNKSILPIKINYHTHTTRCGHASGEDRAYVEAAIQAGLKVLGFSDHTPYPVPSGFKSGMRISLEDTADYFQSITSLKKEYAKDIDIYCGLETEYFPAHFQRLLEYLKPYPLDYMILGQHYVPDEETGFYVGSPFGDSSVLTLYTDCVIEAMKTGCFSYVAHPDLPYYVGPNSKELLKESYKRICEAAKTYNIPLEINCLGNSRDMSIYPTDDFLDTAAVYKNQMIVGLDAHSPKQFSNIANTEDCVNKAAIRGLELVENLKLRNPFECSK